MTAGESPLRPLIVAALILALGCGRGERQATPPAAAPPASAGASAAAPDSALSATASVGPPAPATSPGAATRPGAAPQAAASPTAQPAQDTAAWTAGITAQVHEGAQATLAAVRTGEHAEFDRVVFEFSDRLPSYQLEYVDSPVHACGSGHVVPLPGDAWLRVRFTDARAHDDRGQPTVRTRRLEPKLDYLLELRSTCDFEGEVTWVLALAHPNRYRTLELSGPARLVVDVRR